MFHRLGGEVVERPPRSRKIAGLISDRVIPPKPKTEGVYSFPPHNISFIHSTRPCDVGTQKNHLNNWDNSFEYLQREWIL